jgi:hypothetical protein
MKHRLVLVLAVVVAACAALVAGAAADRGHGRGQLYSFSGELLTAPGPNATTLSVQIETGNRPALRALIGASQNQVFAVDSGTAILIWSHGVPHTGSTADLQAGDFVTVRIRTAGGSSLQQIESTPAATVADTAHPGARGPLWLFSGTVAGPQSGGKIALHVGSGNWKALQAMLGQALDQSFAYDDGTIFLLWQGRVPTVISPAQLQTGDRITVRIRAPRNATLTQVEATPAAHVGDHEPAPAPAD